MQQEDFMTSKQRREFTAEFKREAVGLLASSGRTIRQIAGITVTLHFLEHRAVS